MTLRGSFIPDRNIALFLDVDGTLLEIAKSPSAVKVPAALRNTLELSALREGGALALISGRSISELDRLFAPGVFCSSGLHGLERRDSLGRISRPDIDTTALDSIRAPLNELSGRYRGLLFEDKGLSLAMHYRLAPTAEPVVRETMDSLAKQLADKFELRRGKCVLELLPRGYSKRTAVEAFMKEEPFANRIPVFIGDDVSDEDGFIAVNEMGGCSIRVGHPAPTNAQYYFGSERAVIAWLRERNLNS